VLFISFWKVADAFVRPNGMTRNSKRPWWVQDAIFSTLASCIRT
jgi:hypothetical protein